jgi:ribose-phosphate pyrophosphokinase
MTTRRIFAGNGCPALARSVCDYFDKELGDITVGCFKDGETSVEINESVRGRDIFIIQSTCQPVNDNLMELVIMADAFKRASARNITAIIPYFGYARQDRRVRSKRVPISAKVVADMIAGVGISRVITVDLHAEQIQGFFKIPVDNIYSSSVVLEDIRKHNQLDTTVVVSPDIGGVVRARAIAKRLHDRDLAIIDKRRPEPNQAQVMNIIGDVRDRDCIIVDDIVDTAGTLCKAAAALKAKGARSVRAYCTHPVLSGDALRNIESSELTEVVVMDSIPLRDEFKNCAKMRVLGLSSIIGETIHRINTDQSVSEMFVAE